MGFVIFTTHTDCYKIYWLILEQKKFYCGILIYFRIIFVENRFFKRTAFELSTWFFFSRPFSHALRNRADDLVLLRWVNAWLLAMLGISFACISFTCFGFALFNFTCFSSACIRFVFVFNPMCSSHMLQNYKNKNKLFQ